MTTITLPTWWFILSGLYFVLSFIWTIALTILVVQVGRKVMPLVEETRIQVRRVSSQAKTVATKASNTADILHAQTQNLLGSANAATNQVTGQARNVGAALTGAMVATRVLSFLRKIF